MSIEESTNQLSQPVEAQAETQVEELDLDKLRADIVKETSDLFNTEIASLKDEINNLSEQLKKKKVLVATAAKQVQTTTLLQDLNSYITVDHLKSIKQGVSINLTGLKEVK